MVATGFAAAGRGLPRSRLGHHLPTPAAKQPPEGAGWIRRFLTPLADPQSWLNSLWVMINFLMSLVTFPLAVAWTVGAIATVGGPVATLILRRSEEHTSELQSRGHLVCRLLLEKKKISEEEDER